MILEYIFNLMIITGIFAILGIGLNIAMGYTGLVNLGYAAFYSIGAYASALVAIHFGFPFLLSLLFGGLVAALFGYILCFPSLRLKGDYLALATLGFGFIIQAILINWISLTNGPMGLSKIPKASIFGFEFSSLFLYFILVLICLILVYLVTRKLVNSPFGRVLKSIRDDELASSMLGKDTFKFKGYALVISGFIGGIAGSLYAHYIRYLDPTASSIAESILVIIIIIVGGLGSIEGSILGALVVIIVPELIRFLPISANLVGPLRQILYALVLIVLIIKRPQGILGEFNAKGDRRKK